MFLARLISYLPFRVLYFISDIAFVVAFYFVQYRRRIVRKNIKNSFPEKSEKERSKIERDFYRNLCDYAVEMLKLLTIDEAELRKRMVYNSPELDGKYAQQKQSIIILASHQFNWEWLIAAAGFSFPMPIDFVYQKVKNQFFEKISKACRTRFGSYAITREEVAREMVRRKNILRGTAMVSDQYPGYGRDKKYITTFLNQESAFFQGTNQLAILMQYPVLFYQIVKVKRGYYVTTGIEIATPPYAADSTVVIDNYISAVENQIRQYPANWLWSHNRWKKRHLEKK